MFKNRTRKKITFYERTDFIKSLRALQKRFNFLYLIAVVNNIWGMWIPLKYQEKIKYYDNCLYICYLLKMSYKVPKNSTLYRKESVFDKAVY